MFFSATQCEGCVELSRQKQGLEEEIKAIQQKNALLEEELRSAKQQLHTFRQSEKMPHAAAKAGLFTQQQVRMIRNLNLKKLC